MTDCRFTSSTLPRPQKTGRIAVQNEHLDAYLAVKGVRELHEELQARGARITKPIGERPWGFVDFYVEDADGYILCFSESQT